MSSCDSRFKTEMLPPIYSVEMRVALVGIIQALWLLVTKERKKNQHSGVVFSCNLIINDILYALTLLSTTVQEDTLSEYVYLSLCGLQVLLGTGAPFLQICQIKQTILCTDFFIVVLVCFFPHLYLPLHSISV